MNLNQITIPVLDVEKLIQFYQKLGLKLIVHSTSHYARLECGNGGTTFLLHKVENNNQNSGIWIYFEIDNLDEKINN